MMDLQVTTQDWGQLVANYEAADPVTGENFAQAMDALLLSPAPHLPALAYKLAVFDANQIVDLWHTAEQISAQLADDARRLIAEPVTPQIPEAWQKAVAAFVAADEAQAAYDRDHLSPAIAAMEADESDPATRAAYDAAQAIFDHLIGVKGKATETLMELPAPDLAGLAIKMGIYADDELCHSTASQDWAKQLADDGRRLTGEVQ